MTYSTPVQTVMATAASITRKATTPSHGASDASGMTYRKIATVCTTVFSLPPREAGITP